MGDTNEKDDENIATPPADDYVTKLFNQIDWTSRAKVNLGEQERWIQPGTWEKYSYTRKYLAYQCEPGYIDLNDPFQIEEENDIRKKVAKKNKKKKKDGEAVDLQVENQ